jgi:hypothetical protein
MGVGGVSRQGEDRSGEGVSQGNCGDEGRFGGGESGQVSMGEFWGYLRARR